MHCASVSVLDPGRAGYIVNELDAWGPAYVFTPLAQVPRLCCLIAFMNLVVKRFHSISILAVLRVHLYVPMSSIFGASLGALLMGASSSTLPSDAVNVSSDTTLMRATLKTMPGAKRSWMDDSSDVQFAIENIVTDVDRSKRSQEPKN